MHIPAAHRPYPMPSSPYAMHQIWHNLLFAHWTLPVEALRARIPAGLEIDTYDGEAWAGVVPFRMRGVRPRGLPPVRGLSAFPELNVRTYVTYQGRPGVWFFSLDAGNPIAVAIARRTFHLPYFRAEMSCEADGTTTHYHSRRTHRGAPEATFQATYRPTGAVYLSEKGTLESWLTERYCLYTTDGRRNLYRGEIHHIPWPLQPAEAEIQVNTMHGDLPLSDAAPVLHYVQEIHMVAWPLVRIAG